ncbi:MAG: lipopolysaccharide heptosyltransferase II [Verrucomicrobia bacterium]|nr:lipopolysaccharide heptosyltransferase II [Verrucomicrobiota bacterium]
MKILIVKPSSLGDIIHALPTVRILRRAYPQAHIAWLINDNFAPLLDGCPVIDRVIPFARRRLGRFSGIPEALRFARSLKAEGFDWAVDLQCLLRSALICWASGARRRTGLADGREGSTFFYNEVVKLPPPPTHAVDRYLMLPRQLGLEVDRIEVPLAGAPVAEREKLILINPGARWATKRWPADRFAALLDAHAARWPDYRLALLGSGDERPLAESIAAGAKAKADILAGRTTLPELTALMRRARLLISNDTGPLHLAVAVGTPTVSMFGPTDPRRTGPYPPNCDSNIVLTGKVECAPCFKSGCRHTPELQCMTAITVEQVVAAAGRLLSK